MTRKPSYQDLEQRIRILEEEALNGRQAEAALRESEQRFRGLIELAVDGILLGSPEGVITGANSSALKILGMGKDALLGRHIQEIFSPGVLSKKPLRFDLLMQGKTVVSEREVVHPDGKCVFIEMHSKKMPNGSYHSIIRDMTERKQAEGALRESEEKFRVLADSTPTAIMLYQDDHWIYANEAAEIISGYTAKELLSMNFWDIVHPDYKELIQERGRMRQRREKTTNRYEFEIITKDGMVKWIELAGASTQIGGRPAGVVSVVDITERKQTEKALKESEEKFAKSFLKSPILMAITDMKDGRYVEVNETFAKVMGLKREELLNNSSTSVGYITAEQRAIFLDEYRRKGFVENLELLMRVKDGDLRHGLFNASKITIGDEDFFLTQVTDITERKKMEEALRHSEQFLRLITENVQDAVRILDLSTLKYTYANSYCQTLFGTSAQNYIDLELGSNLDAEEKKRLFQILQDEIEHDNEKNPNRSRLFELHEKSVLSNEMIWTENKASFLRDKNGKPTAVISITRDITERKRMEQERQKLQERIRRAEKMEAIGTLAGGVAHDLNNVLGVLVGYSELMLEKIPEGSPLKKYADNILQSGQRGAAIIQDLLTLARRGVAISEVVNLNHVITNYIKTPEFENVKAYHSRVTFKTDLAKDLLNIKGSPVHLGKTIMNLISNAAEAISGEGEVIIRTENRYLDQPIRGYDDMQEGEYVILTVSDNGQGIPQKDIGKIFEPFYTKKVMGRSGTGLGLAVVWGTVKDLHGYIDVQSEEGKGSIFTLYFSVTREETVNLKVPLSPDTFMGKGESILVVDDVKEQRELALSMLERLGYKANAVSSGEDAIEYLKNKEIDLIVLDMIMDPGMDGLETYRRILEIRPKQKAIIVSGFSETERIRSAQARGAGVYIRKPYLLEKIGLAVREELDRK